MMSYAIPTSPAEVNSAGREVLNEVFDTEKISEPLLIFKNFPLVNAVEVEAMFTKVPVVKVFPVVAKSNSLPVVILSVVRYIPVPVVIAVASKTKPEEVVAVVTTLEVKVCEPVAEVTLNAPAPATVTPKV